eukprot:COSAG02_NODE_3055_length_7457_cov_4.988312_3_plen_119_part_00
MCASQYQFGIVDRSFRYVNRLACSCNTCSLMSPCLHNQSSRCINGNLKDETLECDGVCNCGSVQHGMCEDEVSSLSVTPRHRLFLSIVLMMTPPTRSILSGAIQPVRLRNVRGAMRLY